MTEMDENSGLAEAQPVSSTLISSSTGTLPKDSSAANQEASFSTSMVSSASTSFQKISSSTMQIAESTPQEDSLLNGTPWATTPTDPLKQTWRLPSSKKKPVVNQQLGLQNAVSTQNASRGKLTLLRLPLLPRPQNSN